MNWLVLLWLASLVLSFTALAVMITLVIARAIRTALERRNLRTRQRLLPVLLEASEGAVDETLTAEVKRHPRAAAGLAIDLLELVHGEDRARLAALFRDLGLAKMAARYLVYGDERVRIAVAEALALFPGEETVRALRARLRDRSPEMRLAAAISLAALDAEPPLREIIQQLGSRHADHSRRLVDLFRQMTDTQSPELLDVARDKDMAPFVRAAAIEALANAGDYELIPALAEITNDPACDPLVVAECVRALGELEHPSGASVVERALEHSDWQVRAEAVEAVGRIGLVEATPRLTLLLADDVWPVRLRAGEALASLGETGRRALRKLAEEGSGRTQRTAALVLAERGLS
ncbi:HEAT repeat domain-containing protein [Microvirga massiliensis]|uniref:HEAT repeat domain-containing protein n=1 Tax=Microvirga massiliensis TaxID=1033741 RepID=UPI00062BE565|nr:HEAT repeat domain-containing protein [Microvirga massiliensis]